MFLTGIKKPLLIASLVIVAALSACGDFDGDYSQSNKVGPKGPTIPSGYYFDLTLSPSVVQSGGDTDSTISITTHVWDANGVGVANVAINYGGDFENGNSVVGATDSNGYDTTILTVSGILEVANRKYITITVEDTTLSASYRTIPVGGI